MTSSARSSTMRGVAVASSRPLPIVPSKKTTSSGKSSVYWPVSASTKSASSKSGVLSDPELPAQASSRSAASTGMPSDQRAPSATV